MTPERTSVDAVASRGAVVVVIGLASLANGVALVLHIVGRLPLPSLLAVTWTTAVASVGGVAVLGGPLARTAIARYIAVGLVVGIAAAIAAEDGLPERGWLNPRSPWSPSTTSVDCRWSIAVVP